MDIRQLRYFKTVAELGSFSAAARSLGIAQPALSRHVKALEEHLGVQLVLRTARGVRLTKRGEHFLHYSSGLLRQFDMLPSVVSGQDEVSGRVAVGFPTSVSAMLSKQLIRATLDRYPGVHLHLIESLSGYLLEWIEAGRLDICVLYDTSPGRTLTLEPLAVEDLYLIGNAQSFRSDDPEIPFARLSDYRLAMPGAPHALRRLAETMATSNGVDLNIVIEIDSLPVIKSVAETEGLMTMLPYGVAKPEIDANRLEARRIVSPKVSRSLSIATSSLRESTRAINTIKTLIREVASGSLLNTPKF